MKFLNNRVEQQKLGKIENYYGFQNIQYLPQVQIKQQRNIRQKIKIFKTNRGGKINFIIQVKKHILCFKFKITKNTKKLINSIEKSIMNFYDLQH